MLRISICTLALVASLSQPLIAADGVIYTCVDAKGARTYQNDPCPASSATHGARVYVDPGWNPQAAAKIEADRQAVERSRQGSGSRAGGGWRLYDAKDCQNARVRRDRIRRQIGSQRITWEQELEFCRPVESACGSCSPGVPQILP